MKYVHILLQGKGGAGKSFAANLLSQFVRSLDPDSLVIDIDPLNQSTYKIKSLNALFFNVLNDRKDDIDKTLFDKIIDEAILESDADHIVIDTGSSSFVQLSTYIDQFKIIQSLSAFGYVVLFHFVVNGGSEQDEAMKLTTEFCNIFYNIMSTEDPDFYSEQKPLVIWFNPMPTKVIFDNEYGDFYHDPNYIAVSDILRGCINLPVYSNDGVVKKDIMTMMKHSLTFNEFYQQKYNKETGEFGLISKQRIKTYQSEVNAALKAIIS